MASIFIPKEVVSGFRQIIKLSKKEIEQISNYLINAKVTSQIPKFLVDFERFVDSELKLKNPQELVQTITSFGELFNKEENYEVIADNLSKSFKELYAPNISAAEFKSLQGNLNQILKSGSSLQLSSKANKLITENNNLYRKSKVLSDIRLVLTIKWN